MGTLVQQFQDGISGSFRRQAARRAKLMQNRLTGVALGIGGVRVREQAQERAGQSVGGAGVLD